MINSPACSCRTSQMATRLSYPLCPTGGTWPWTPNRPPEAPEKHLHGLLTCILYDTCQVSVSLETKHWADFIIWRLELVSPYISPATFISTCELLSSAILLPYTALGLRLTCFLWPQPDLYGPNVTAPRYLKACERDAGPLVVPAEGTKGLIASQLLCVYRAQINM